MKRLLFLFLAVTIFCLLSQEATACYRAYQLRYFPIGSINNDLLVLELDLVRNPRYKNIWEGAITLKIMHDSSTFSEIFKYDSVAIYDSIYSFSLKEYINEAISCADTLSGFLKGEILDIEYCRHKKRSKSLRIISDKDNNLKLFAKKNQVHHVKYPERVLQEIDFLGALKNQPFRLQSIRKLKIGANKYYIANISTGEIESSKIITDKIKCSQIEDCAYKEITLYHGLCFDVIFPIKTE